MYVTAIVLAAGSGIRLKSKASKALVELGGKPLIIHSLKTISSNPQVKEIIVAANPLNKKQILERIEKYKIPKIKSIVLGGRERKDSVFNALKQVSSEAGMVLIHDAARPLIAASEVARLIKEAGKFGAAILGVPVKSTIKKAGAGFISKTLDRNNLWEAQTPQAFKKDLILSAYKRFKHLKATDDAMLVEKLGARVRIIEGSYRNIKITTREDLITAQALLKTI